MVDRSDPPWRPCRAPGELAIEGSRGGVRRQRAECRKAEPHPGPGKPDPVRRSAVRGLRPGRGEEAPHAPPAVLQWRPRCDRHHRVEDRGTWCADDEGRPGPEPPGTFPEDPYPCGPAHRGEQCRSHRRPDEHTHAEGQLYGGEEPVEDDRVGGDERGRPEHRGPHEMGLAGGRWRDHPLGKARGEHERLELERPVKDPDDPEHHLEEATVSTWEPANRPGRCVTGAVRYGLGQRWGGPRRGDGDQ